jgi:hypothetical protein
MKKVVLFIISLCFCSAMLFAGVPTEKLLKWFSENNCSFSTSILQYDYEHYNSVIGRSVAPLGKGHELNASKWNVLVNAQEVQERSDALDVEVTFECVSGKIEQAAVSVNLNFKDWNRDNYVLLPSVAYNGNKFESRRIPYSPKLSFVQDIGPDKPIIVSDVLRLDNGDGVSRIQDRSGAFAAPALCFQSSSTRKGFILLTNYGNSMGDYSLSVEESRNRGNATFAITSPCMREQYVYKICDSRVPSWDKGHDFSAGDKVTVHFRVYGFAADKVTDLFHRYAEVRKDMERGILRNTLPYSICQKIQENKFNTQNFVPDFGYYSVGMRNGFLQDWQIGWTGGMISTYPLLFMGNEQTCQNVIRNFDWLFPNGISPSGFFWDACEKGNRWLGGDIRKPQSANWHLIRKSGDAVYYIIKQFLLMDSKGMTVKSAWKEGTIRVCDALVNLWNKNHQFGQFVDSRTGVICVGGSSSGAIIPAALTLAGRYFGNQSYLQVAQEAAEYYYRNFTSKGIACGGPGDALQNPDSESSYSLVESYALLYEQTGDKKWLQYAEDAARQFSSWVTCGDYPFPKESLFGKAGVCSMGAVYANTQNKHGAPAICTASGIALLRIYRATGDAFFLHLLQDIAHNITQYLPCKYNPIGNAKEGWVCERVNMSDWEGPDRIGEIVGLSTWAETGLMLTTVEIPGVYIQPDKGMATAFDNVQLTSSVKRGRLQSCTITNPFSLPIKIMVLAENASDRLKPLNENRLYTAQTISLKARESKKLSF